MPWGLRTVAGSFNNLIDGQSDFGATDRMFPRLTVPVFNQAENVTIDLDGPGPLNVGDPTSYTQTKGFVFDSRPRVITNLISDQTVNNPAAVSAAGSNATPSPVTGSLFIPNIAPDEGISAPFNEWFMFFGQFFDHGLDLVRKGGSGAVFTPLKPDDPLFNPQSPQTNFMVLTRATNQPGPDGILGTSDDLHEHINETSPFVDQNQTYASHPSHQVFLRAYKIAGNGSPVAAPITIIVSREKSDDSIPDITPPIITILGENPVETISGSPYIDAGAVALDNIDPVVIVNSASTVNINIIGNYTIIYSATDKAGNTAEAVRTVKVVAAPPAPDTNPPLITVLGANPVNIMVGDAYNDASATALDNIDGNITAKIQVSSNVNTALAGTYTVIYTVSDSSGNMSAASRSVNITPKLLTANVSGSDSVFANGPVFSGGGGGSAPEIPLQSIGQLATVSKTNDIFGLKESLSNSSGKEEQTGMVLGVSIFKFNTDLKIGMKGSDVSELKKLLKNKGFYKGRIDDKFNLRLNKALKLYQKSVDLKQTGKLDSATREKLNNKNNSISKKKAKNS